MGKKGKPLSGADLPPRVQAGALPWRCNGHDGVEVLLITSRETGRWVIPKGWPIKGLKAPQTAAREAFEEAGVEGEVTKKLGAYHYDKRLPGGRQQQVQVVLYPACRDRARNLARGPSARKAMGRAQGSGRAGERTGSRGDHEIVFAKVGLCRLERRQRRLLVPRSDPPVGWIPGNLRLNRPQHPVGELGGASSRDEIPTARK